MKWLFSIRSHSGNKPILFRVFMTVWGIVAIAVALSGLPDDYRFRRDGIETIGVFEGHTGIVGDRNDRGILSYSVNGRRYHLTSLQGTGFYKLGGKAKLYYLPNRPHKAREAGYLSFNLIWLILGVVALNLSVFAGRVAKLLSPLIARFARE